MYTDAVSICKLVVLLTIYMNICNSCINSLKLFGQVATWIGVKVTIFYYSLFTHFFYFSRGASIKVSRIISASQFISLYVFLLIITITQIILFLTFIVSCIASLLIISIFVRILMLKI